MALDQMMILKHYQHLIVSDRGIDMDDVKQRLDRIKELISDADFLANKGLSNEVGIYVFDYNPKDEMIVREFIHKLVETPSNDYRIIEYNLYKIFLEILEDEDILDTMPDFEEEEGKESFLNEIHNNNAPPEEYINKMIYEPTLPGDVIIITGVGAVYPFMRASIILNKMQKYFTGVPILLFYPGTYNGQTLNLFDKFHDDNYYRAFNKI